MWFHANLDGPAGPWWPDNSGSCVGVSAPRFNALKAAGRTPPPWQSVLALVDTGASCTCIDPSVIEALDLQPTGTVPIHTPTTGGTPKVCNQYDVGLALLIAPQQVHVSAFTIAVVEAALSEQGIQALIGRDVLSKGMLVYNGVHGSLSLAF